MKPWEVLAQATTPEGYPISLVRRDTEYRILADGKELMTSRVKESEQALATIGCKRAAKSATPRVLVGGLGMGFTLRSALEALPADAEVVVAELVPAVVEWNRGVLADLAGRPLTDRRVRIEIGDVGDILSAATGKFDAVLLDVDNGPEAFSTPSNDGIYDRAGLLIAKASLRRSGILAVWSSFRDPKFERRLHLSGFTVETHEVKQKDGSRHTIFIGKL